MAVVLRRQLSAAVHDGLRDPRAAGRVLADAERVQELVNQQDLSARLFPSNWTNRLPYT